jgi:hypothetical protein
MNHFAAAASSMMQTTADFGITVEALVPRISGFEADSAATVIPDDLVNSMTNK